MSSGDARRSDVAPVGSVVRMIQRNPGLRNFLNRPQIVSRKFLVPYGAGRSMDGGMTYADENIPERFKMGVEPDKYAAAHEGFEWWLMTRLGMKYWQGPGSRSAHWWAEGYEHYMLRLDGWSDEDIEAYENEWDTYLSIDEGQRISSNTVPPDLYTGPYEAGMDSDEAEDGMDSRILPVLQSARMKMMQTMNARLIA
jgi:hypothetical protein